MSQPRTRNRIRLPLPVTEVTGVGNREDLCSTLLWRIENMSAWDMGIHGKEIASPEFKFSNMGDAVWRVGAFPKGKQKTDDTFFLRILMVSGGTSVTFDAVWSLLNEHGLPIVSKRLEKLVLKKGVSLYFWNCPSKEDIFVTKREELLPNDSLTLELRVWQHRDEFIMAEHITAISRVKILNQAVMWKTENFESIGIGEERSVSIGNEFELVMSLTGKSIDEARLQFEISAEDARHQSVTVELFSVDRDQRIFAGRHIWNHSVRKQTWLLPAFVTRQEVLDSNWLRGGCLVLVCGCRSVLAEIQRSVEHAYTGPVNPDITAMRSSFVTRTDRDETRAVTETSQTFTETNCKSLEVLGEDLLAMYQSNLLSDFEVRCGVASFSVHKSILSARSEVLKAEISNNSAFLEESDLDASTIGLMLTFLYAGSLHGLVFDRAMDLYRAAVKYRVATLRVECLAALRLGLAPSNVIDVLKLAEWHQDSDLTSFAHDYILNNYERIVLSEEWDTFLEESLLGGKTMQDLYKKQLESGNYIKLLRSADGSHLV